MALPLMQPQTTSTLFVAAKQGRVQNQLGLVSEPEAHTSVSSMPKKKKAGSELSALMPEKKCFCTCPEHNQKSKGSLKEALTEGRTPSSAPSLFHGAFMTRIPPGTSGHALTAEMPVVR